VEVRSVLTLPSDFTVDLAAMLSTKLRKLCRRVSVANVIIKTDISYKVKMLAALTA